MDRELIARKLDSLDRCLRRIDAKRPAFAEDLAADIDCQDILSVNLERAVQLCVDMGAHMLVSVGKPPPETMGDVFTLLDEAGVIQGNLALAMRMAVGFRNLSVHAYDRVDWARVFEIVHHRLDDFRQFAAAVAGHSDLP